MSGPDFSDGTMVALQVPPGTASRIAIPDGTPVDDMHCTLAFLGSASALSDEEKAGIVASAREAAHDAYPLEGSLPSRVGTFDAGADGTPYWADPGAPGVHGVRENLLRSLSARGLDHLVSTTHDFNPHVTLSYLPDGAQPPDPSTVPQPEPFTFTHLIVKVGPDRQTFPLGSPHVDSSPEPDLDPATESPLSVTASARTPRVRITPQTEHSLRCLLERHNSNAQLGQRTTIETLKAVYLRGANDPQAAAILASARGARGTDRVRAFLEALVASSGHLHQDADLCPPPPRHSSLDPVLQLATRLHAYEVRDVLTASLLFPPTSPNRTFNLNRALALAATSPSPSVRAALPAPLRTLIADGNSQTSRSLRAKRQLRDRYGRWIEMGGGIRFKVRRPGTPGGGQWFHGTATGQDVPNGLVNVRLDDGTEVSVPADKVEQPLAILNTDPRGVGNRPQDHAAPATGEPEPPSAHDTGQQPSADETQAALDDANSELTKRVKDDSTESHHRDTLVKAAQAATSETSTPEELAEHLAQLSEYADNVARGNAGRMTPEEREAFTSYAEDIQDVIAAQRPTEARLPAPGAHRPAAPAAPDEPTEDPKLAKPRVPDGPRPMPEIRAPEEPDAIPVPTSPDAPHPDTLLPELHEFDEAAQAVRAAHAQTSPDSPGRDRLASVSNVVENVGDDFLSGAVPADEAMDALAKAHDELDSILSDHFDDMEPDAEGEIEDAMDRILKVNARIKEWNDTPDPDEQEDSDAPSPAPESPSSPAPEEPPTEPEDDLAPAPTPVLGNARQTLASKIEREQEWLDSIEQEIPDDAKDALETMRVALDNPDGESPTDQMNMLDMAFDDYEQAIGEGGAYTLQAAIDRYRESQGLQAPTPDREADPWADPTPRAEKSPGEVPTPDEVADPENYPDEPDPVRAERIEYEDARSDYENGLLPDDELTPKMQVLLNKLQDDDTPEAQDLHDEVRTWFNGRTPVPSQDEAPVSAPSTPGPTPEPSAPASGETDQFDNPVPDGFKLNRETNLPGNRKVQVYTLADEDPNSPSKVDVAVGPDRNGDPSYVVRYRNTARSNHKDWESAEGAAREERATAQGRNVEDQARNQRRDAQRAEQERAQQEQNDRRTRDNLDDADRPLPEGWSRDTLPGGTPVLTGPGRYRAFTDANGDLHLMVRDNQGGFAAVGSFPDWDALQEGMGQDSARRSQSQRDELGEWLAGHGFSEDTVNALRTTQSADDARDAIMDDPRYPEMSAAAQDAAEVDTHTPAQRRAADDWTALQGQLDNVEDLPGDEVQPDAPGTPVPGPGPGPAPGGLSPMQDLLIDGFIADLEEGGNTPEAEALTAFLDGDPSLRDSIDEDTREGMRDEIVGRVQQARDAGELNPEDATDLVERADAFYGVQLPNDPNDGLIEPIRAPEAQPPEGAPVPGAPPGQETRYHPDGVIQDRFGNQIAQGARVQARRDGAMGQVVAVQQQPPYARIRFDDGRTLVRAGAQLNLVDAAQPAPAAPAPPAPRVAPEPVPDAVPAPGAPAVGGDQAIQNLVALRETIPRQIGRAGHADPANVARRNAGFAIDDALLALNRGDQREADRHLVRAIQRLGFGDETALQLSDIRRALNGEQPAAPTREPALAPGNAGPLQAGRQPGDWLVPSAQGTYGERPLNPTPAGVVYASPPETRLDAAKPTASVDDYQAWGDRAGEITQAARTRPSFDALEQADHDLEDQIAAVFNADGQTTFGNKGYTVKIDTVNRTGAGYTTTFDIYDADGVRVPDAKLTRSLMRNAVTGKMWVTNAYMRLPADFQGTGFASAWNRNVENWAIANDFDHVKVSAGLDKGGLIWALAGFDWEQTDGWEAGSHATMLLRGIKREARANPAALNQIKELERRILSAQNANDRSQVPTPLELALVGWRPGMKNSAWPGARGLLGADWEGRKKLTPESPSFAQADGFAQAKRAAQRIQNNENVIPQPSDTFIRDLAQGEYVDLHLDPTETAELTDVLMNERSLASLTPATKRKVRLWATGYMNGAGGGSDDFQDVYNLTRGLIAEQIADAPPGDVSVGRELAGISAQDAFMNTVPGWNIEGLGGASGINTTYRATHNASGQTFFWKAETSAVGSATGRGAVRGRDAELDVNQLLRLAGGGWYGVNEYIPSDVEESVVIMPRVGDNVDMARRPQNAGSSGALAHTGFENLNDPSAGLRMFVLDIATGNGDRHVGNWQLGKDSEGLFHVFPIDHGFAAGGGNWITVDQADLDTIVTYLGTQGIYQSVKQSLAKYDGHSVEYMARQIIQDYRDALGQDAEWRDPEFVAKVSGQLDKIEQNIRLILRQMGK